MRQIVNWLHHWLHQKTGAWWRQRLPKPELFSAVPSGQIAYKRLQRVVVTEEVCRTFFEEFAEHRRGSRGDEEIGWVLMGHRLEEEVLVLATLPAGTARSASSVHVRFDSEAQALAARVLRQKDKRLAIVGVVHTHPGSLRHPSDGDFHGDSLWVRHLRGGEGVFGIGTADGREYAEPATIAQDAQFAQPEPHMQTLFELCFSWYALGTGERRYRRLPVLSAPGPDLAEPLHLAWPVLEAHAAGLDRLFRQLSGVSLEGVPGRPEPTLALNVKLAEPGDSLRVLLERERIQYIVNREGDLCAVEPQASGLERALYLILAELAMSAGPAQPDAKEYVHGLPTPQ